MEHPETTELVTRLRECVVGHPALMDAAANEIERLRATLREIRRENVGAILRGAKDASRRADEALRLAIEIAQPQTTGPRKPQVAVEIEGREVRLIVMCSNHYDAIKMYGDLVASCRHGNFTLSMDVSNAE